jgi:uncharacterized phage-associated protein
LNRLGHDPKRVAENVLWLAREDPITPIEAWRYGPVVPAVYHAYKRFGGRFISDQPKDAPSDFSEAERYVMQQVWNSYGKYTGLQLSELTHKPGTPWDVTRRTSGLGAIIPDDLIEDFYRRLARHK